MVLAFTMRACQHRYRTIQFHPRACVNGTQTAVVVGLDEPVNTAEMAA